MTLRNSGEPRLDIQFLEPVSSPDCLTVASLSADATAVYVTDFPDDGRGENSTDVRDGLDHVVMLSFQETQSILRFLPVWNGLSAALGMSR